MKEFMVGFMCGLGTVVIALISAAFVTPARMSYRFGHTVPRDDSDDKPECCPACKSNMQEVRPGKTQCPRCG